VRGLAPAEAARLGNATAAHCVQAVGSTTGILPLPKILKFMRAHGG
jgi:sugar/nucleoside kinase (ribokinase family)